MVIFSTNKVVCVCVRVCHFTATLHRPLAFFSYNVTMGDLVGLCYVSGECQSNSLCHRFCYATVRNWLTTRLSPLFHPMRKQPKLNGHLLALLALRQTLCDSSGRVMTLVYGMLLSLRNLSFKKKKKRLLFDILTSEDSIRLIYEISSSFKKSSSSSRFPKIVFSE